MGFFFSKFEDLEVVFIKKSVKMKNDNNNFTGGRLQIIGNDSLLIGSIPEGSIDDIRLDIRPENRLALSVPVEGHSRADSGQRQNVIRLAAGVERIHPQFRFLREYQQFRGARRARPVVGRQQQQSGRTETRPAGSVGQAEVRASAVVASAAVGVVGLAQRMDAVDVHGEVQVGADGPHVVARQLVGLLDAFRVPIRPENRIFEDADGKRMRQSAIHHSTTSTSIQFHTFNYICNKFIN